MSLKRELVKTGNFFPIISQSLVTVSRRIQGETVSSIIPIGISFHGFYFEPRMMVRVKKSKQNTRKPLLDENVKFPKYQYSYTYSYVISRYILLRLHGDGKRNCRYTP
jgi:hypothetical protein